MALIARFHPRPGGGGAVTFRGSVPNQAVYWSLVSVNEETGVEGPALGRLKWSKTHTGASRCCLNFYFASQTPTPGVHDRVKVRYVT